MLPTKGTAYLLHWFFILKDRFWILDFVSGRSGNNSNYFCMTMALGTLFADRTEITKKMEMSNACLPYSFAYVGR